MIVIRAFIFFKTKSMPVLVGFKFTFLILIFEFLLKRVNRTYEEIYQIVEKMDTISLEKKRQLTIPLIRELI